jgi:hypothetical protein
VVIQQLPKEITARFAARRRSRSGLSRVLRPIILP